MIESIQKLLHQAQQLNAEQQFTSVIHLLNTRVLKKLNSAELYAERAQAYYKLKDIKRTYKDANTSIAINPSYPKAYNYRGNTWLDKENYDEAIKDYDEALKLDPLYAYAYHNKGLAYYYKDNYDIALELYNKALTLDNDFAIAYANRGFLRLENGFYNEAIKDFKQAVKLDKIGYKYLRNYISLAKDRIYSNSIITQEEFLEDNKGTYIWFKSLVARLEDSDGHEIASKGDKIMEGIVKKIKEYSCESVHSNVVHYTKLHVADSLIQGDNGCLRYYNAVYMNDPEEGKIILDCFQNDKIVKAFNKGQTEEENNIYLGSFLPARVADNLVLWRTYGKDESNAEAKGCSIEINSSFFDREVSFLMTAESVVSDFSDNSTSEGLYRVKYYNRIDKVFSNDKEYLFTNLIKQLGYELNELVLLKGGRNTKRNMVIDKIIYKIISEVAYLIKSSEYEFEEELRIIQLEPPRSEKVKIEDGTVIPRRVYIESKKSVLTYLEKIILGPKVSNPHQWIYLEVMAKKKKGTLVVKPSALKFQ